MRAFFAYDGRLATAMLALFSVFVVSSQFVLAALPALVFERAVGWQASHGAIWLGVVVFAPIGPAVFATLECMGAFLDEGGWVRRPLRRFWGAYARALTQFWPFWSGLAVLEVVLAYDLALYGASDLLFVVVACVSVLAVLGVIAVGSSNVADAKTGVVPAVLQAAKRPHIVAGWLLVLVVAAALSSIPVIGPSLYLLLPASASLVILIVNRAMGFRPVGGAIEKA